MTKLNLTGHHEERIRSIALAIATLRADDEK
jgi:hypothetical protein